jgi:DNL zinc finger
LSIMRRTIAILPTVSKAAATRSGAVVARPLLAAAVSNLPWSAWQHNNGQGDWRSPFSTVTTNTNDEGQGGTTHAPLNVPGATLSKSDKMVILYTCRVCDTRSARTISKPAYNEGVVLVRCPGCQKLHLIADRLGYFGDEDADVEKLLAAKGERVRRATLDAPELKLASGSSSASAAPAATPTRAPTAADRSANIAAAMANSADSFVLEFTEEDLRVLKSSTKSINLKTNEEVVPKPPPPQQPAGTFKV